MCTFCHNIRLIILLLSTFFLWNKKQYSADHYLLSMKIIMFDNYCQVTVLPLYIFINNIKKSSIFISHLIDKTFMNNILIYTFRFSLLRSIIFC